MTINDCTHIQKNHYYHAEVKGLKLYEHVLGFQNYKKQFEYL